MERPSVETFLTYEQKNEKLFHSAVNINYKLASNMTHRGNVAFSFGFSRSSVIAFVTSSLWRTE